MTRGGTQRHEVVQQFAADGIRKQLQKHGTAEGSRYKRGGGGNVTESRKHECIANMLNDILEPDNEPPE